MECEGTAAAVVVAAAVDVKIMTDQNAAAPFLRVPNFSSSEFVVVPSSPEQDSSIVADAVAAVQVDHCLPAAPTLLVQCHPFLLE